MGVRGVLRTPRTLIFSASLGSRLSSYFLKYKADRWNSNDRLFC